MSDRAFWSGGASNSNDNINSIHHLNSRVNANANENPNPNVNVNGRPSARDTHRIVSTTTLLRSNSNQNNTNNSNNDAASSMTHSAAPSVPFQQQQQPQTSSRSDTQHDSMMMCERCGYANADIRVEYLDSNTSPDCYFHTRCYPLIVEDPAKSNSDPQQSSSSSSSSSSSVQSVKCLRLLPMTFDELDRATATAVQHKIQRQQQQQRVALKKKLQQKQEHLNPLSQHPALSSTSTHPSTGRLPSDNNVIETSNTKSVDPDSATTTNPDATSSLLEIESSDLRTGRWTNEETAFCDHLIQLFEKGQFPIPNGVKLNDFLSGMLRSKQSRLTKKMKNAKLSSRQYRSTSGYILDTREAERFSQSEQDFLESLRCDVERSELRFHIQKEWRELFSTVCVERGEDDDDRGGGGGGGEKHYHHFPSLVADLWLASIEEMDRRASARKDAARMARRKERMGYALGRDHLNQQTGVFIDPFSTVSATHSDSGEEGKTVESSSPITAPAHSPSQHQRSSHHLCAPSRKNRSGNLPPRRPVGSYSSPFVGKVMHFLQCRNVPFEHIDAWVPSLISSDNDGVNASSSQESGSRASSSNGGSGSQCRLCFAGSATADMRVPPGGVGPAVPINVDDRFDLISFGLYSQKFSFEVGCGLPGRVYESGIPSWEQGIAGAPPHRFERCGGAQQWGIQTVLGLPISSPNVGRIVVLFYSCIDRPRDDALVSRMINELTKLMPTPRWKLVVDIGLPPEPDSSSSSLSSAEKETTTKPENTQSDDWICKEMLRLLDIYTPADKSMPLAEFLPGFSSLRLLISFHACDSVRERDILKASIEFFRLYRSRGMSDKDSIWMTARDVMIISKHSIKSSHLEPSASLIPAEQALPPPISDTDADADEQRQLQQQLCPPSKRFKSQRHVLAQEQQKIQQESYFLNHHVGLARNGRDVVNGFGAGIFDATPNPISGDENYSFLVVPAHHPADFMGTIAVGGTELNSSTVEDIVSSASSGLSPTLQPILSSDMNGDSLSHFSLGLNAYQLASLLQTDSFMPRSAN